MKIKFAHTYIECSEWCLGHSMCSEMLAMIRTGMNWDELVLVSMSGRGPTYHILLLPPLITSRKCA